MDPSASARIPAPAVAPSESVAPTIPVAPLPALVVAESAEPGPEFWAGELEWARARFPELRDFIVDVDFAPLLEWVPEGQEVTLFINVEHEHFPSHCAAALVARGTDEYPIEIKIPGPERLEKGERVRNYVGGSADQQMVYLGGGGKERRKADGSWEEFDGASVGFSELGASVGPVVGDTAHFRYTRVRIDASCGPRPLVPCGDGRNQYCNLCEEVTLTLSDPNAMQRSEPDAVGGCSGPCPKLPNPDLDRIKRFAEHFPGGLVPLPISLSVALYRTHAACKADPLWKPKPKPASTNTNAPKP